MRNEPFNHVLTAASSSWLQVRISPVYHSLHFPCLQEHAADFSHALCHVVPGLSRILLPRLNPARLADVLRRRVAAYWQHYLVLSRGLLVGWTRWAQLCLSGGRVSAACGHCRRTRDLFCCKRRRRTCLISSTDVCGKREHWTECWS